MRIAVKLILWAFLAVSVARATSITLTIGAEDGWGNTSGTIVLTVAEYDSVNNRARYQISGKNFNANGYYGPWATLQDIRFNYESADSGATSGAIGQVGSSVWLSAAAAKNPYKFRIQGYWSLGGWIGNTPSQQLITVVSSQPIPTPVQPATPQKKSPVLQVTNEFTRPLKVTYKDKVTGEVLYTATLQGGETLLHNFANPNGNDVTVSYELPEGAVFKSLDQNGQVQFFAYPQGHTWTGTDMPSSSFSESPPVWQAPASSTPAPSASSATVTTAPTAATSDIDPATNGKKISGGKTNVIYTTDTNTTNPATDKTFREGVSGIVDKLDDVKKSIDEAEKNRKADRTTDLSTLQADKDAAAASYASAQSQVGAKKTEAESSVSGRSIPTFTASGSGSASGLSITMPIAGATINMDPADNPQVSALASWIKGAIAWFIVAVFQWWLWSEFRNVYLVLSFSPQARGNAVAAGTGAQATSLVAALAITGILVSVPGLFWAQADSGLSVVAGAETIVSTVTSGAPSIGLYLFTFFFPLGTLLAVLTQIFVVRKFGLVLIAGTQTAIRFVIP